MKGLLVKDFYMVFKHCRTLLIAIAFFVIAGAFATVPYFMMFSAIMAGVVAFTLISYDENSGWNQYADTLPVTRSQQVAVKYLITVIFVVISMAILCIAVLIAGLINHSFSLQNLLILMSVYVLLGFLSPSVLLPAIYKFGLQKGRLVYYALIGAISAISFAALDTDDPMQKLSFLADYSWAVVPGTILIFALSWLISTLVYNKKEIA